MNCGAIIPYSLRKCRPAILTIAMTLSVLTTLGQSVNIKGRIRDTALNKDCALAVVALLLPDSTLVQFTRSHKDGSFSFHDLPAGKYQLWITHPSYSDYRIGLTVKEASLTDLGALTLPPRVDALEAVIVTPKDNRPRMHGVTLEYNTSHIKTRVNATVDELLARLPGVQIDQNGVITVNGKKIERLLVDGEDLFGNNPTIVTKNFNADMIAKVQIMDRKSDQSQFTGIDDGQKTKTLNLTLKQDSKQGYFSKVEGGGDTKGYYDANAMLGSFRGARQFAALGMAANTGNTGFSGAVNGMGSDLNLSGGSNDALGAVAGGGIPRAMGGGIHYANKWNGNQDHGVGNYQYGRLTNDPYSSGIVQQTLPDSIYTQRQESHSHNVMDQHGFNGSYDYIPDTINAFRFSLGGSSMQGRHQFLAAGNSDFNDTLVNSNLRTIHDEVSSRNFRGGAMWRIQGRREKSRIFSVAAGFATSDNTTNGFLYSQNTFYQPSGSLLRTDTTDQRKSIGTSGLSLNTGLSYTQPIWKNAVLGLSYGLSFDRSQSLQSTYNKGDGKYENYLDSLSTHYRNNVLTQQATLNLQATGKLLSYTLGGNITHSIYAQQDLLKASMLGYHYLNFAPRINVIYNIDDYKGWNLDYGGSTQQPSITDLQPVQNNNDPLHIAIGNPDLHPSFSQSFGLSYHNLKPIVINLGLNYGFTTNSISTKTYTDSLGRQISQAVNTSGTKSAGFNVSINKRLERLNLDLSLLANANYGRSVNYVNQLLSKNDNYNTGWSYALNRYVSDKYGVNVGSNFTYSYTRSSINLAAATHYWTQNHIAGVFVYLLPGLQLNSNFIYTWRQKIDHFDQHNTTISWNANIGKDFLENRLAIRWQINDILGQNAGITRMISSNQTSESTVNIIGRYWMLVATYRIIHHKKMD